MLTLDGSIGEGGGQILRTSLALSMVTGQAFRVHAIRARRQKPGLMRQHLVAVRAAAEVCQAEVSGDSIGSRELIFRPRTPKHGDYHFAIGSAGSATLVLQTVLPALLDCEGRSTLVLEGGTHNPMAPPYDFLERAFLPILNKMGARVTANLVSYGFYPAGGGRIEVTVEGGRALSRLELLERGAIKQTKMRALVSQIPGAIAVREVDAFLEKVPWDRAVARPLVIKDSPGPGNVVIADIESEHVTEVFTGFGERGVRAELVAEGVAKEVSFYLEKGVPVGEHLADQLLLPMALGQGGEFRTYAPSGHTKTQVDVMKTFSAADIELLARDEHDVRVIVKSARA
jgi:RNA 3'-terminal phosphate cyclase (ATP)